MGVCGVCGVCVGSRALRWDQLADEKEVGGSIAGMMCNSQEHTDGSKTNPYCCNNSPLPRYVALIKLEKGWYWYWGVLLFVTLWLLLLTWLNQFEALHCPSKLHSLQHRDLLVG